MHAADPLAERFEQHRTRLSTVARRILGSASDAEDAVQEAWIRFSRSDTDAVEDVGSWLTTVVARMCLNMLEARRLRSEITSDVATPKPGVICETGADPEEETTLADAIGLAMLVVLETLTPAERVAFVLHDVFAVPFEEIAPIVGRSTPAARQLASRARRRVRHRGQDQHSDRLRQARLVDAFLAASRHGDFDALLAVLHPDVVLHADDAAVGMGVAAQLRGASQVARFCRRARGARPSLVDGTAGAVWMPGDRPRVIFAFTTSQDKITGIDLIADPERLLQIDLVIAER